MATLPKVYLEHLAEISPDIIIAVDRTGSIVFYNDGARRTLGYSSEEVLGRHVTLIYGDLAEARRLMTAMRSADRDAVGTHAQLRDRLDRQGREPHSDGDLRSDHQGCGGQRDRLDRLRQGPA